MVVFGVAVHSVAGSILLWGNFPVEGIFPLELTWVQTPFPPKTLSDESINRGLVCAHMHFIARTQKILTFMAYTGECGNKSTHSTHHPRRRNLTILMVGFKKTVTYTKVSFKSGEPLLLLLLISLLLLLLFLFFFSSSSSSFFFFFFLSSSSSSLLLLLLLL